MLLRKYKHPLIVTAAQGKCGKGYIAHMIWLSIRRLVWSEEKQKQLYEEDGKSSHEFLWHVMGSHIVVGLQEPNEILKNRFPSYPYKTFETIYDEAEALFHQWTLPHMEKFLNKGVTLDAESKFLVMTYLFIKKYVHPDSLRIIEINRPLHSIAYQNCRVGAYHLLHPQFYYLGNLLAPWCRNNITIPPKPIEEITQQELCVWYTFEMEERKKLIRAYFPDSPVFVWDMEKDTKDFNRLLSLLQFASTNRQTLETKGLHHTIYNDSSIVHPGPDKCHLVCTNRTEYCTEEYFKDLVTSYKIIYNEEPRREGLL